MYEEREGRLLENMVMGIKLPVCYKLRREAALIFLNGNWPYEAIIFPVNFRKIRLG